MPFPSAEGGASPELDEIVHGPAAALTAVALVVGPAARASGWAAAAAVALAGRWPGPRRIVLVDLGLDAPSLHEVAGVPNDEGVVDVVEYGVSLAVVRRTVADGGFDLVTPGLYIPEPAAVLRSAAWTRVLAEVSRQRGTLLAWLPADADGGEAIIARAGAVLVLAHAEEAGDVVQRLPQPYAVLAVLTPEASADPDADEPLVVAAGADAVLAGAAVQEQVDDGTAAVAEDEPVVVAAAVQDVIPPPAEEPEAGAQAVAEVEAAPAPDVAAAAPQPGEETTREIAVEPRREGARLSDEEFERIRLPTDRETRETLIADLRDRQRAARMTPPPAGAGAAAGSTSEFLIPDSYSEHARDVRTETMGDDVTLETMAPDAHDGAEDRRRNRNPLIWTVLVVLLVAVIGGSWRFLQGRLGMGVAVEQPVPVVAPEPVVPVTPPGVELPYAVAMEAYNDLAAALRRLDTLAGEEGFTFHIAPLERENTLYYHIMAGPVPDSATALALRDSLLARRIKTAATPTDVRYAPLAFLVGDYGSMDAAVDAMTDLRRLDVPGYLLLTDAADGALAWRVYVGGFGSAAEAEVTRQLLHAAGVRDSLVTRTGSTPQ